MADYLVKHRSKVMISRQLFEQPCEECYEAESDVITECGKNLCARCERGERWRRAERYRGERNG